MKQCAVCGIWLALMISARSELPALADKEWMGYFAVHESQRYDFLMQATGQMRLIPRHRDKEQVTDLNQIKIHYGIEEVLPNGTTVFKETHLSSLSSEQAPTKEIRRQLVRGRSTGDAEFELVVEQSRDVMSLGGRVIRAGKLTKYPLRFALRLVIPNVYRTAELSMKDDAREFEQRIRGDYMELRRVDGNKDKLDARDRGLMNAEEVSGKGIEQVEMRISYFEGRRFYFQSSKNAVIMVSDSGDARPWYEGMTLQWLPDTVADADGRARLSFCVK